MLEIHYDEKKKNIHAFLATHEKSSRSVCMLCILHYATLEMLCFLKRMQECANLITLHTGQVAKKLFVSDYSAMFMNGTAE